MTLNKPTEIKRKVKITTLGNTEGFSEGLPKVINDKYYTYVNSKVDIRNPIFQKRNHD